MADTYLDACIERSTPKLNPILARGVATTQLKPDNAMEYIKSAIRSAERSFIEGLAFVDSRRCTPEEHYRFLTAGKSQRMFDIARSDYFLAKYLFTYNGKELRPRYMCIPFVEDGGFIHLRGVRHLVSPTLNDKVFSVTDDTVFVRLERDRFRFHRLQHSYLVNDSQVEVASVVWAPIHSMANKHTAIKAHTCTTHYLFAKYGFQEAFQRFVGFVPIVGQQDTINHANYPADQWTILSTVGHRPRSLAKMEWYPTPLRIAVPKEDYDTNARLRSMIAGFFYITDHFPTRVRLDWINHPRLWRVLMGMLIHSVDSNEGILAEKINDHIRSTDDYVGHKVTRQLHDLGYDIKDFYELLVLLTDKFSGWLAISTDYINSMNGKELNVNTFTLYPITSAIIKTMYNINQRLNTRRTVTEDNIEKSFDRYFKPMAIFDITKDNAEISALTASNDSMALRLTTIIIPQTSNDYGASKININDPAVLLHPSIAEFGSINNLPKSYPDGRSRLNHYAQVDDGFGLIRNPDFIALLEQTNQRLKRI